MMSTNLLASEYSPDGKLFAIINEHGILKIWDTETNSLKQEYAPDLHLAGPCTCLTWIIIDQNISSKKSKKKRKSVTEIDNSIKGDLSLYIAFGTSKGGVSLYSFALGEVERNLKGEGHNGKVCSLVFDKQDILYTGGEDGYVICWSLSNEKRIASWSIGKDKITNLAYLNNSNSLLIGSRQLKLFSLEKQEVMQTFVGHTSDVILLNSFVYDSVDYCLSAAKNERIISLWTLKCKQKYRNATATFLMEDIPLFLSVKFNEDDKTLKICVVTRSGVVHIYSINMESIKSDKPIKPVTTINVASDGQTNTEPILAVTASLEYGNVNEELLLGYGDNQFLIFEKIAPNYSEKVQVLIRSHPRKVSVRVNKKINEKISKTAVPIVNSHNVQYQISSIPVNRKKRDDIQIPLETRLQNLHVNNGELPSAQSKVQLLIQSLHSKDASLLNAVLATDDLKVINLTVQKLPVQYVASLVNELTLLMEKKHANVKISASWLKAIIKAHSSQLMALGYDDLISKFGPCIGIIEHRSNCLKDLSRLNGRLQLLVGQIKRNVDEDTLTNENCLVFEDDSNSEYEENEMEDNNASTSDDNDDWEEEENEDKEMNSKNEKINDSDVEDDDRMDEST